MRVSFATEPGDPEIENEDFVGATPNAAVVLDGVTPLDRADTGCRHGVAWYARTLGTQLLLTTADGSGARPLADYLADAIAGTRDRHADTCDLAHPDSPAATVAMVRIRAAAGLVDYLVLSDAVVVLDIDPEPHEITDHRAGAVGRRLRESGVRPTGPEVRAHRNRPDGYWVAAERPEAAYRALTGTVEVAGLRGVVVASDGATRLVDTFESLDWPAALALLDAEGLDAWLARTRQVEQTAGRDGSRRRRGKLHDDASIVLIRP